MLIWMREGTHAGIMKFVLMGLLLVAVGGLVLMDAGGFFKGGGVSANTVVKGPGINISVPEFDRIVRRNLQGQNIGPTEAYQLGYVNAIITNEIQGRLFAQEAKDVGLHVHDEDVMRQLSKLAAPLAQSGMTKKEALQRALKAQGLTEHQFVEILRQEIASGLLRDAIVPPATLAPTALVDNLYRYDHETRSVQAFVLKNDGVKDYTKPTDDDLKKFYETTKSSYVIPEARTITIATLSSDLLKKSVTVSAEEVKAAYDKNPSAYTKPERRTVEQVAMKTEDEAKKVKEALAAGHSLKESVKIATGKEDSYLGINNLETEGLSQDVSKPVFSAEVGDVVGPIETALGWHVIAIKAIIPAQLEPFDSVKDHLKEELTADALNDEMNQAGNTIEDRIAGGATLDEIVKEYGMTTEKIGPFRQNGYNAAGADLFKAYDTDRTALLQTAFDYEEGEVAPIVQTADGKFLIVQVDSVIDEGYKSFDSVKQDVESKWIREQQATMNKARTLEALASLNAGKSLADVAKTYGVIPTDYKNLSRRAPPPSPLNPMVVGQIFSKDKAAYFSSEIEGGAIVGQVNAITLPPAPAASDKDGNKDIAEMRDFLNQSFSQDMLGFYMGGLSKKKAIRINQNALQQRYGKQQE